jgi:predicted  nucleic acid-binding Zn-ribbon protein
MTEKTDVTISGNGIDSLVGKLIRLADTATLALEAYTRERVEDLRIDELDIVRSLRKDVRIADLQERKSNLERRKARLEHEVHTLEAKKARLERETREPRPKPVVQVAPAAKEAAKAKRDAPLTHKPLNGIKEVVQAAVVKEAEVVKATKPEEMTEAEWAALEKATQPEATVAVAP